MAGDPLADLRADLAKPEPETAPEASPAPATWRDPWAKIMQTITPKLDQAGVLGSKEGYLRQAGGMLMPQNTAELALAGMMAAQPELAAAKVGVPLMEKVAAKGVLPALTRAALRGMATGGIAKATGSGAFGSSSLAGGAGSLGGEVLGKLGTSYAQSAGGKLALSNVTNDLADAFRQTIGRWLPKDASAERILRAVAADEPSAAVGAALNELKAAHAKTPVRVIDLEPQMTEAGVVFEMPRAPSKLTPGRELATRRAVAEVPLGEALDTIRAQRARWQGSTAPEAPLRLAQLQGFEDTLAERADPQYAQLLKEYGRTKQLRHLMWGSDAPAAHGETPAGGLFEGRTGKLSWEGYTDLAQRVGLRAPKLYGFTPDEVGRFGTALRLDLGAGGMVTGQAGSGPIKSLGLGITGRPHARIGMPRASWMPGWEGDAGAMRATLAPAAVRAITGQMPLHLTPDRRDE